MLFFVHLSHSQNTGCNAGNELPIFSNISNHGANYILGTKYTLASAGTLTGLSMNGVGGSGSNVQMALYADNGGVPGALLVTSAAGAVTAGTVTLAVTPMALAAGDYWQMAIFDVGGAVTTIDYNNSEVVYYTSSSYGSALPANGAGFVSYTGQKFNYWMNITCGSGGGGNCNTGNELPIFSNISNHGANYILGTKYTLASAGTLTGLSMNGVGGSGSNVQMALYADNGGVPGALLVTSAAGAVTAGTVTLAVTPMALAAGDYWQMAIFDVGGAVTTIDYNNSEVVYYTSSSYGSALPANGAGFVSYTGQKFNYWMNITCGSGGGGNTITCAANTNSFCTGSSVSVAYTATGTFTSGNTFTAQLSDANGSFAAPVSIGSVSALTSGSIGATLPNGTAAGTGYRIRVVSSNPATTGSDNGTNITVNDLPVGSASNITVCNGDPSNLPLNSSLTGTSFSWTSAVTLGSIIGNGSCPSGCGTTIADVLTNLGNVHGTVDYTITPISAEGCVGSPFTSAVTVGAAPAQPVITGPSVVCLLNTAIYSVAAVPEATTYTWTVPTGVTGMTITSGQGTNTIHVNISAGTVVGNVTCTASNSCGNSTTAIMAVTKKPSVPGPISGPSSVCGQSTAAYFIAPVFGATSYTWIAPAGMTITSGQGTLAITVSMTTTFISGLLKVSAVNACGNIPGTALLVTGNVPGMPLSLSGPANVCGITSATYSVPAVAGATGYNWTVVGAGTIVGSNTGTSVTVALTGTSGGSISCQATNVCGNGTARTVNLVVTSPQPAAISGPNSICGSTSATYSVPSLGVGYTYNWSITLLGWSITSGNGTNSITISGPATGTTSSGLVKVTSSNTCGMTSAFRTMSVSYCHDAVGMNNSISSKNTFFGLYPNPATSDFTIDVTSEMDKEITIEVYDVLGNLVINAKHQLVSGTNSMKTNIQDFENGMYFVRLLDVDSNVLYSQRVIKQ